MKSFDAALRKGFEKLIGIELPMRLWRLAQLPPKYGGMALRSGLTTYGAQHLCSLAKVADNVERIVGVWDVLSIAHRDTAEWLTNAREEPVDLDETVNSIRASRAFQISRTDNRDRIGEYNYSLAQLCELSEQKRVPNDINVI